MKEPLTLKYSEDDILEIVTEYMAEKHKFGEYHSKSMIFGIPGKDLRLVAIIGDLDDESIRNTNLEDVDLKIDYNGEHSKIKGMDKDDLLKLKNRLKDLKEI